jgi:hypothetical protein
MEKTQILVPVLNSFRGNQPLAHGQYYEKQLEGSF